MPMPQNYIKGVVKQECVCPICKIVHLEQWGRAQRVRPWRYCKAHKHLRGEEDEGVNTRGASCRSNTAAKKKRAV